MGYKYPCALCGQHFTESDVVTQLEDADIFHQACWVQVLAAADDSWLDMIYRDAVPYTDIHKDWTA